MTTKRSMKWSLAVAAAACLAVAAMPGCELLVDFDRSLIPSDASVDVNLPTEASPSQKETGVDADEGDGAVEGATEAGDGGSDATDGAGDAQEEGDGASDAKEKDAPSDAKSDGAKDSGKDTGTDSGHKDAAKD